MRTSPYFKAVMTALATLVLLLTSIFYSVAHGADNKVHAPIVKIHGDHMDQIGWYTYTRREDVVILYCVPEGDTRLSCMTFMGGTKHGNVIVVVEADAQEIGS